MPRIALFQKVTLALDVDAGPGAAADLEPLNPVFSFIFGIGRDGLTPFEFMLAEQEEGGAVRFAVEPADRQRFFERLAPQVEPLLRGREGTGFSARILKIETPEPREIVRALAQTAGHGGGSCDCGCGCGG